MVDLLKAVRADVYVLGTRRGKEDSHFGTRQTPGLPDLFVFLPPLPDTPYRQVLWIEVKTPLGKLRAAQRVFRALAEEANGLRYLVGGIDDLIALLEQGGWLKR